MRRKLSWSHFPKYQNRSVLYSATEAKYQETVQYLVPQRFKSLGPSEGPEMAGRSHRKEAPKRKPRPSQVVKAARAVKNPLSSVSAGLPSLPDVPLTVTTSRGLQLSKSDVDWMYDSVKRDLGGALCGVHHAVERCGKA